MRKRRLGILEWLIIFLWKVLWLILRILWVYVVREWWTFPGENKNKH